MNVAELYICISVSPSVKKTSSSSRFFISDRHHSRVPPLSGPHHSPSVVAMSRPKSQEAGSVPPTSSSSGTSQRPLVASVKELSGPVKPPVSSSEPGVALSIDEAAGQLASANGNGDAQGISREINVVESYEAHLRQNPRRFIEQIRAAWNGEGWRGYSDYIGAPILMPGQSDRTAKDVLTSDNVQSRIKTLAQQRTEALYPQHVVESQQDPETRRRYQATKSRMQRALERQLTDVANSQVQVSIGRLDSLSFIKVFAATVNNILTRMYPAGIHVDIPQVLEVRRVAQYAAERKQSILFLPCHKSHIDYLTVSWLLFRVGVSLPAIVAGEVSAIEMLTRGALC